jgi:hypothetical protein
MCVDPMQVIPSDGKNTHQRALGPSSNDILVPAPKWSYYVQSTLQCPNEKEEVGNEGRETPSRGYTIPRS